MPAAEVQRAHTVAGFRAIRSVQRERTTVTTEIDDVLRPETTGEQVEQPRDEQGRFAKQEVAAPVEEAKPVEAEPKPKEDAYKTAMLEERRKRQELEARLRAREEAKSLPEPPPFWDDPDKSIEARLDRMRHELQSDYLNRYYNALESAARARHQDYDEVRDVFVEKARDNPALAAQLNNHPDPAEFAYQQGKLLRELSTVNNDIDAYRKRIEDEVRAKLAAEMQRPSVPKSLNSEPSSPTQTGTWSPASLESLMNIKV